MKKEKEGTSVRNIGVLILHGFGGDRSEVEPLASYLETGGLQISVPLLPGHGGDRRELRRVSRRDWIAAAETAYAELAARCAKVYVIGFSMGGLLAVHFLAGSFPFHNNSDEVVGAGALCGLITVNTPVYYWNLRQIAANLRNEMGGKSVDGKPVGEGWRKRYLCCAQGLPPRAMLEFQLLLSGSKRLYGRLHCPALILQLADDDTVWPSSGDYILRRMKGSRRLLKLPQGGHQVFQSDQAGEACHAIGSFIGAHEAAGCRYPTQAYQPLNAAVRCRPTPADAN